MCPSLALQLLHLFKKKKCLPPNFESTFQSFTRIRNIFCSPLNTMVLQTMTIFFVLWIIWTFSPFILWLHLEKFLAVYSFFLQMPFGRLFWLELWTLGNIGMISLRSFWFLVLDYQDFLGIWYRPALRLKRKTRESIERLKRDTRGWE